MAFQRLKPLPQSGSVEIASHITSFHTPHCHIHCLRCREKKCTKSIRLMVHLSPWCSDNETSLRRKCSENGGIRLGAVQVPCCKCRLETILIDNECSTNTKFWMRYLEEEVPGYKTIGQSKKIWSRLRNFCLVALLLHKPVLKLGRSDRTLQGCKNL